MLVFDALMRTRPVLGVTPLEALRSQVSALVFVDAHFPDNGQSGVDTSNGREEIFSRPPKSAEYLRVNENDRTWVDGKLTPQPIGTSLQPIRLTGAREEVARKAYVRATGSRANRSSTPLPKQRRVVGTRTRCRPDMTS